MKKVYLIAVVFALIAGFATFLFASELSDRISYQDAEKKTVAVALVDVPANTTINAENFGTYFEMKDVVSSYALDGAVVDSSKVIGTITRQQIFKGEQLTSKKLITADSDDATLSLTLPSGYVAYPIKASGTNGGDGFFAVGDKVDVYLFNGAKTDVPLSNLEVLVVSTKSDNDTAESDGKSINSYSTITLLVTEEQAKVLNEIESSNAKYKFVLKPRVANLDDIKDNSGEQTTAAANADYTDVQ